MSSADATTAVTTRSEARIARSERMRLLLRSPTVIVGAIVVAFWLFCALFPRLVAPYDPIFDNQFPPSMKPEWGHPFGTDHDRPRRLLTCPRRLAQHSPHRTRGHAARHRARNDPGAVHRLLPRRRRRRGKPLHRRGAVAPADRHVDPDRDRDREVGHLGRDPRDRTDLRAGRVEDGARSRAERGRAGLRAGGAPAGRAGAVHHVQGDPAERDVADRRRVHGAAWVRDLHRRLADLHRVRRATALPRLGGADQPVLDAHRPLLVDDVLPCPRDREPRGGVNLVADGVRQVYER